VVQRIFYYRRLISTFARKNATLELAIVHADTPTLPSNLARNDAAAQIAIYTRLPNRLVSAAAECVGIIDCRIFRIDDFKAVSPLPVVDMIAEVGPGRRNSRSQTNRNYWNSHSDGDALLWAHR
jgi:aspartate racemase